MSCVHWRAETMLSTGARLAVFGCRRHIPTMGSRYECDQYRRDPDVDTD
jgi:hypothetical protein